MNNKGQALVEFVLILPIFLMIMFIIVDFGMIFNAKSSLENDSSDIVNLFKNGEELTSIKNLYPKLDINIVSEGNYYKITIASDVDLITPGMNVFMEDPFPIEVERIIPYA